ncbi:MAG: LapA family protein [Desulfobacteraceae bacterium]|nr:LapA family protein [Desulfobacteraceae bacterium]
MRLLKPVVGLVVLVLIALFVWQNAETWGSVANFKLDLYFSQAAWSFQLYVLMFLSALIGFLVGILVILKPHLSLRRQVARERKEKKAEEQAQIDQGQQAAS